MRFGASKYSFDGECSLRRPGGHGHIEMASKTQVLLLKRDEILQFCEKLDQILLY